MYAQHVLARLLRLSLAGLSLLALVGVLAASPTVARAGAAGTECQGAFQATVTSGSDTGLSLRGDLAFTIAPSGSLSGTLDEENGEGSGVPVSGGVSGGTITLVFALGGDSQISGSGPFAGCSGTGAGTLRGPAPNDQGNWGVIWGN